MTIPQGQSWLTKRMKKLGYPSNDSGVCFAVAHMALQAIHSGSLDEELANFDKRLEILADIPEDNLNIEIETIRNQVISISKQVRNKFLQMNQLSEQSFVLMRTEERVEWQKKINQKSPLPYY